MRHDTDRGRRRCGQRVEDEGQRGAEACRRRAYSKMAQPAALRFVYLMMKMSDNSIRWNVA
jgi:hypothetical protein